MGRLTANPPPWAGVFARLYDLSLAQAERAGMRERRRALIATASGRTLELGAGTGLNVEHYTNAVTELTLAEPEPAMRRLLARRVAARGLGSVIDARAESLPFTDGSLDTVLCTLVLCTVEDPAAALAEVARVLAPGGRFLFIEHVRAESAWLGGLQDRLHGPWRRLVVGCRCNRRTARIMHEAGFEVDVREARWRRVPPIVAPLILGSATLRGT